MNACGGGYLPHRFSKTNGYDNPSVYCDDLYSMFENMQSVLASHLYVSKPGGERLVQRRNRLVAKPVLDIVGQGSGRAVTVGRTQPHSPEADRFHPLGDPVRPGGERICEGDDGKSVATLRPRPPSSCQRMTCTAPAGRNAPIDPLPLSHQPPPARTPRGGSACRR